MARQEMAVRRVLGCLCWHCAAFTAVTTEMLPVGLLPQISHEFHRAESTTGLLVSLYAVDGDGARGADDPGHPSCSRQARAARSPCSATRVSNLVCALAPSFGVFAVARGLGGLTHAVFFSVCIGYASRLVPADGVGRALALVSVGPSAALILGSPLATALGDAAGWRMAFGALVVLTLVTFALLAVILPAVEV